jgi:hypothetical protein
MVCNTQNYWAYGICPSFGILNARKQNVSETERVSILKLRERDAYFVGCLRKS